MDNITMRYLMVELSIVIPENGARYIEYYRQNRTQYVHWKKPDA